MGVNHLTLGEPVDYRIGRERSCTRAREALVSKHIVHIANFPTDGPTLVEFGSCFGTVRPRSSTLQSTIEDYVGVVQLRHDIEPEARLVTQDNAELRPHTAHSWGLERPRYFALLMVDPGWTDSDPGTHGESLFVAVADALDTMAQRWPNHYDDDSRHLTHTPVEFWGKLRRSAVSRQPLLFPVAERGPLGIRYREGMLDALSECVDTITDGEQFLEAVNRLDQALLTAPRVELQLGSGDLILLDNRLVTHARRPFVARSDSGLWNPRLVYSLHVYADPDPGAQELGDRLVHAARVHTGDSDAGDATRQRAGSPPCHGAHRSIDR